MNLNIVQILQVDVHSEKLSFLIPNPLYIDPFIASLPPVWQMLWNFNVGHGLGMSKRSYLADMVSSDG